MQDYVWRMDEHDKDEEMDSMSRSNRWKDYGCMQENVWIMHMDMESANGWMKGK